MSTPDDRTAVVRFTGGTRSALAATVDRQEATGHGEGGPAPKRIVVGYGFWIFLLSDIVMFSAFFAAYAVLSQATAGGPAAHNFSTSAMFGSKPRVCLLSSFCCGIATLAVEQRADSDSPSWRCSRHGLLGLAFLALELREFAGP